MKVEVLEGTTLYNEKLYYKGEVFEVFEGLPYDDERVKIVDNSKSRRILTRVDREKFINEAKENFKKQGIEVSQNELENLADDMDDTLSKESLEEPKPPSQRKASTNSKSKK